MPELTCDDCQQSYAVWFADNEVWNLVMGGPECKGDPGGMLCPRCFALLAESTYDRPRWRLELVNHHGIRPPGCDCTELCSMGPTCPGGSLAGLPGSGCWRTDGA